MKYKPLKPNSKFAKANKYGQVPIHCLNFNNYGKHCWQDGDYETNATDCCVLEEGIYCDCYKAGSSYAS